MDQLNLSLQFAPQSRRHTDGVKSGHSIRTIAHLDSRHIASFPPTCIGRIVPISAKGPLPSVAAHLPAHFMRWLTEARWLAFYFSRRKILSQEVRSIKFFFPSAPPCLGESNHWGQPDIFQFPSAGVHFLTKHDLWPFARIPELKRQGPNTARPKKHDSFGFAESGTEEPNWFPGMRRFLTEPRRCRR